MEAKRQPAPSFWVIGGLLLLWEGIGAAVYLQQADIGALEETPLFVTALFGIAVWGGLAAAALLLLRRRWAVPLFLLSVIAVSIQIVHGLFAGMLVLPAQWAIAALTVGIGVFATWYAARAQRKLWLR